jgi:signal transduction histidine kinase
MAPDSTLPARLSGWPKRALLLFEVALELASEHDLPAVLQRIVDGAATVADARYAALGVYGDGRIINFVHCGLDEDAVARIGYLPEGRGLLGEVIVGEGPVRLAAISTHPASVGFPPGHPPMQSFLGVPVARGSRRYGNLYLTEKRSATGFSDEDEAFVVALAGFAAGAIESAQLVESERARVVAVAEAAAAEERARTRRVMLGEVLAAQEAERARVSRDLHDDVGQALTSVLLGLRLVERSFADDDVDLADGRRRVADVRDLVTDALMRARRLAFDLRPTVLDDIGLAPALQRLGEDVAERTGLVVEVAVHSGDGDARFAEEFETVVYRVVQEALTNVVRHAHATSASVTVTLADGRLRALVEDDGVGFDPDAPRTGRHLGFAGMSERAQLAGGNLTVDSRPDYGTTIRLEVPIG